MTSDRLREIRHLLGDYSYVDELYDEIAKLHDVLEWLVHLHYGVSKGGGTPSPTEWDSAFEQAELLAFWNKEEG